MYYDVDPLSSFPLHRLNPQRNPPSRIFDSIFWISKVYRYYGLGRRSLSVVCISNEFMVYNFIFNQQDLGCLRNAFNGKKLIVQHCDQLQSRVTLFHQTANPRVNRVIRYMKRGFTISNLTWEEVLPYEVFILRRTDAEKQIVEWYVNEYTFRQLYNIAFQWGTNRGGPPQEDLFFGVSLMKLIPSFFFSPFSQFSTVVLLIIFGYVSFIELWRKVGFTPLSYLRQAILAKHLEFRPPILLSILNGILNTNKQKHPQPFTYEAFNPAYDYSKQSWQTHDIRPTLY